MVHGNYHMHTTWCDGKADIAAYIEEARKRGLNYLGFSAHAPVPIPNEWTLKQEHVQPYLEDLRNWKTRTNGDPVVLAGLEIDFFENPAEIGQMDFSSVHLDFSIGSVHYCKGPNSGQYLTVDGKIQEFTDLLDNEFDSNIEKLVAEYFRLYAKMAERGSYTFLGHYDLIKKRNKEGGFFDEKSPWYKEMALSALNAVAHRHHVLEINTGGLSRGATDEIYPAPFIIKEAVKNGIEFCINSDAHTPDHLDYGIQEAAEALKSCGADGYLYLTPSGWSRQAL
jgi:histidinol-phosphatase (PHP family)